MRSLAALVSTPAMLDVGAAVGVGLLLGMQRERTYARRGAAGVAGARTFPLVALLGATLGLGGAETGAWLPAAGLLVLGLLVVAAYRRGPGAEGIGLTTEVALLLTYGVGVAAVSGYREVATVVGAAALLLMALKERLHGFVGRLSDEDETAALKFVAVALLLVPILPDTDVGPYGAFNPRDVGLRVTLVAGISFAGYVATKLAGTGKGILFTGLLGGLVSSTATTAAFARRSRQTPESSAALAAGTLASCAVLLPRVLFLASVGTVVLAKTAAPGLLGMALVAIGGGLLGLRASRRAGAVDVPLRNPFELRPAVEFALVYSVVVLGAKFAEATAGTSGLFAAAALSGTTDVDAITLTASRLTATGGDPATMARVVFVAIVANSVVKTGLAFALGSRAYASRVAGGLLATAVVGGLAVALVG